MEENKLELLVLEVLGEVRGINGRLDKLEAKVDNLEVRFDKLEAKVDNLEVKFDKLEAKVDNLEVRFDKLEAKVDNLEGRFDKLERGQEEIKQCIKNNNVAIAEIITKALEDNESKMQATYITKKGLLQVVK